MKYFLIRNISKKFNLYYNTVNECLKYFQFTSQTVSNKIYWIHVERAKISPRIAKTTNKLFAEKTFLYK